MKEYSKRITPLLNLHVSLYLPTEGYLLWIDQLLILPPATWQLIPFHIILTSYKSSIFFSFLFKTPNILCGKLLSQHHHPHPVCLVQVSNSRYRDKLPTRLFLYGLLAYLCLNHSIHFLFNLFLLF